MLELINRQLTEKGLKVEKASAAVIDATIIQTAGSKQRQSIEVDEEGQVSGQSECAKPSEGDVFEPVEGRQQAKCACCRLKGGLDT